MEGSLVIIAADTAIILRRSALLDLPGEIRNRVYDHVFGTKHLHFATQYVMTPYEPQPDGCVSDPRCGRASVDRITEHRGLYTLRQTCRQIATETEHYLFSTLDFSDRLGVICTRLEDEKFETHHQLFVDTMRNGWQHVRHFVINSYRMRNILDNCYQSPSDLVLPPTGWFSDDDDASKADEIVWPVDARNLTTLTIHYMDKRKASERDEMLKVLGFYFPKLEDVRCTYDIEEECIPPDRHPKPISGCMRRFRICNGELRWWYTGEFFKKLPEEPTAEQWFGMLARISGDVGQMMSSLSVNERVPVD